MEGQMKPEKILMRGNDAMAEAAIIAGCRHYFGYPITPQNEVPAYMAKRMPEVGGVFLQSESEVAAINMVMGASAAGVRAMTSSSSPGISLKQQGISYLAGARLPCVIANVQRAGPGLGGIGPAQGDYFQAVKGGGHGDYHMIVLAPSSVQETADLTRDAFDYADLYRTPVMILSDATIGQMMEPLVLPGPSGKKLPEKTWALTGAQDRPRNVIRSYFTREEDIFANNEAIQAVYETIKKELCLFEEYKTDDAEIVLIAYGITARISKAVVHSLRKKGVKAGLLRPITLWPFPSDPISRLASAGKKFLVCEMSYGQLVEDVKLAVNGLSEVGFYGIAGGFLPQADKIMEKAEGMVRK
jgi:2-oxoglutarate/2-oxoacid ferredoxin oxidoreductase subunit alpha